MASMSYDEYEKFGWRYSALEPKLADKLHDFLMNPASRPDLQTPGGQHFLRSIEQFHNDKTDALMPWLTREYKKGRLKNTQSLDDRLQTHPVGRALPDELKWALQAHDRGKPYDVGGAADIPALYKELSGNGTPNFSFNDPDQTEYEHPLHLAPSTVNHWGDFMRSNHPVRRGLGDIMRHNIGSFHNKVQEWDQAMEDERKQEALAGGQVVHTTPEGYTIRRLTTPDELTAEGDAMGHCVGGYHDQVARGDTMIYSLRDPQGHPHVTTEIEPNQHEWTDSSGNPHRTDMKNTHTDPGTEYMNTHPIPHQGNIVQIQGAANREPKDEYKAQMKHWFDSFPEEDRPQREKDQWNDRGGPEEVNSVDELYPSHFDPPTGVDAYGLKVPPPSFNWPNMVDSVLPRLYNYDSAHGDQLYQLAKAHRQIPEFGKAVQDFADEQQNSFNDMTEQNWEHGPQADWDDPNFDEEEHNRQQAEFEQELTNNHPGMQATNHMYELLMPHHNSQSQQFENEPVWQPQLPGVTQPVQPGTFQ